MKLTPLDIRRQEFKRVVRGIDPEEVSVFLDMVAGEYERILRENKDVMEERDELKRRVDELDSMREAIQGAVVMAKKSSDEVLSQARKEAELRLKEAEVQSERILEDARRQSAMFKKEINDIRNQRSILVGRLKSLLDGQMKMLEAYVGDWTQDERHSRLAAGNEAPSRMDEVPYSEAADKSWPSRTGPSYARPDRPGSSVHEDELPDVPSDMPASSGHSGEQEPSAKTQRTGSREQPEVATQQRRAEPMRAPIRPDHVDDGRWIGEMRQRVMHSSGCVDRPSFLRPPRPLVDRDIPGERETGAQTRQAGRPEEDSSRPVRELNPREGE